jgi:hypothetical protein
VRRILLAFSLLLLASLAHAETPLASLNGGWSGSGTDRATPFQTLQPAQCRMQINASATRLNSTSTCDGAGGLKKELKMAVTFSGSEFTGTVEQVSRQGNSEPTIYSGKITGQRTGDRAELTATFPGFTPTVYVSLELTSQAAMAMKVTTLGATLTDVTYQRPANARQETRAPHQARRSRPD